MVQNRVRPTNFLLDSCISQMRNLIEIRSLILKMKHADEWIDFRIILQFMNFVQSSCKSLSVRDLKYCARMPLSYGTLRDILMTAVLSAQVT